MRRYIHEVPTFPGLSLHVNSNSIRDEILFEIYEFAFSS